MISVQLLVLKKKKNSKINNTITLQYHMTCIIYIYTYNIILGIYYFILV